MASYGKLVQVVKNPLSDEFETIYGISCGKTGRHFLDFAEIEFHDSSEELYPNCYIDGARYRITCGDDNFKTIHIFNGRLVEEQKESYLLVIVPYGLHSFSATATQLAGRRSSEAILEMHEGDTLEVTTAYTKPPNYRYAPPQKFVAVQVENEMMLVKKTRP